MKTVSLTAEASFVGRFILPAAAFAALTWLMSVAYGFQYLVMGNTASHLTYFRLATVPYVALVGLLTWLAVVPSTPAFDLTKTPPWIGLVMMSVSWLLTCYFYSSMIAPLPWFALAFAVPALAALAFKRAGSRFGNAVFCAGALGLFAYLILRFPHDAGGDMLQIIGFAANDLLRGTNPFQPYLTVSGKEVPFGYWPGVWLPYVPLIALGIDARVLNLCVLVLIIAMFARTAGGGERAATVLALVLFPFLLSSQLLQMVLFGHLWVYWLLVCATLYFVAGRRYVPAGVLFGLCLASRPTALFIAAPLVAYVWSRGGFAQVLRAGAIALTVVIGLNLPFALIFGEDFLANSYGRLIGWSQVLTHFSVAGLLGAAGLDILCMPIQVLIALAAFAFIVARRSLSAPQFVMICGLVYIWEELFASYATRYMYFPGFFLIALGLTMAGADKEGAGQYLKFDQ